MPPVILVIIKIFTSKVGEDIQTNKRLVTSLKNDEAALTSEKAILEDSGEYSCNLRNDLGQERLTIKVIVLDKPLQPEGPLEVSDIKPDGCVLSWKPPKVSHSNNKHISV